VGFLYDSSGAISPILSPIELDCENVKKGKKTRRNIIFLIVLF
jgi:hypothetical protein